MAPRQFPPRFPLCLRSLQLRQQVPHKSHVPAPYNAIYNISLLCFKYARYNISLLCFKLSLISLNGSPSTHFSNSLTSLMCNDQSGVHFVRLKPHRHRFIVQFELTIPVYPIDLKGMEVDMLFEITRFIVYRELIPKARYSGEHQKSFSPLGNPSNQQTYHTISFSEIQQNPQR